MPSVEQRIKSQFAKCFSHRDWSLFKKMAEYYFRSAVSLKTKDITADPALRLLARNTQKRLFIGVGVELLLKSLYLKHGYAINRLRAGVPIEPRFPVALTAVSPDQLNPHDTHTLNDVIQNLPQIVALQGAEQIDEGLRIAKVFRNKEGHVVVGRHHFEARDYRAIECALIEIYCQGFAEQLRVRFSLGPGEKSAWRIT